MNTLAMLAALAVSVSATPDSSSFGAIASAPLPGGSLALWAMAGYPELRAGFREGFALAEVGAELGFDYLSAKGYGVATLRAPLLVGTRLRWSLDLEAGAFADGGATLEDPGNQRSAGVRLGAGSTLTYKTSWPIALLALARIPVEVPFNSAGTHAVALLGGGAEVAFTQDSYVLLSGDFGPDLRNQPGGIVTRLAVEVMLGFGYRVF